MTIIEDICVIIVATEGTAAWIRRGFMVLFFLISMYFLAKSKR